MQRHRMFEYADFSTNVQTMVDTLYTAEAENTNESKNYGNKHTGHGAIDKSFYQVRRSVCVAGYHRMAIQDIKQKMARILEEPAALESFHVKDAADAADGAFLVPKIVLVAVHTPGRKVLDEEGDGGQLDLLYDAACDACSDVMVVYVGLPKTIYKHKSHIIYHPKMEELVFPSQPLLRHLANENCFLTVCEGSDLTALQRNVLREWLVRPVNDDHPVYLVADQMSAAETSESELSSTWPGYDAKQGVENGAYKYATEDHPIADMKKKRKKKKKRGFGFSNIKRKITSRDRVKDLIDMEGLDPVEEDLEDESNLELNESRIEMRMYKSTEKVLQSSGSAIF